MRASVPRAEWRIALATGKLGVFVGAPCAGPRNCGRALTMTGGRHTGWVSEGRSRDTRTAGGTVVADASQGRRGDTAATRAPPPRHAAATQRGARTISASNSASTASGSSAAPGAFRSSSNPCSDSGSVRAPPSSSPPYGCGGPKVPKPVPASSGRRGSASPLGRMAAPPDGNSAHKWRVTATGDAVGPNQQWGFLSRDATRRETAPRRGAHTDVTCLISARLAPGGPAGQPPRQLCPLARWLARTARQPRPG